MYADDTTIYFNLDDFPANNREIAINKELYKVNVCLKLNTLILNVEKTKCIFFQKKTHSRKDIFIYRQQKHFDAVFHFIFLRLFIDKNLSWKKSHNNGYKQTIQS